MWRIVSCIREDNGTYCPVIYSNIWMSHANYFSGLHRLKIPGLILMLIIITNVNRRRRSRRRRRRRRRSRRQRLVVRQLQDSNRLYV